MSFDSVFKYVLGKLRLIGNTDGTNIGNYSDRLKTFPVPDKSGSGSITSGSGSSSYVEAPTDGCGGASFLITGTWVGTIVFEGSLDGTWGNPVTLTFLNMASSATGTSATGNGSYFCAAGTFQKVRVRCSAYTSGTVAVAWNTGAAQQTPSNVEVLSPLPGFVARSNQVLAAGKSNLTLYTMTSNIALVDFHFGGRGPGQASLLRVGLTPDTQVPGGGFNSSADVALWTYTGGTTLTAPSPDYSTAQAHEGTGALEWIFTQSAGNTFPQQTYTWSSSQDLSAWRYVSAWFYNAPPAGGAVTRTISIILTDTNGNKRNYDVSGSSTASPFNASGWVQILGDIENPTSETNVSGTFDVYNVISIAVQLKDSGNKSGTVYWDDVRFSTSLSLIERIYVDANRTFQLTLNPTELFDIGAVLGVKYKNNDTVAHEYTATAKGVLR